MSLKEKLYQHRPQTVRAKTHGLNSCKLYFFRGRDTVPFLLGRRVYLVGQQQAEKSSNNFGHNMTGVRNFTHLDNALICFEGFSGPALSVAGPGALCVGPALFVSGPGALCRAPALSASGPAISASGLAKLSLSVSGSALCIACFLCWALAQRPFCVGACALCVGPRRSPGARCVWARRSLCRAPALSRRSVSGPGALSLGPRPLCRAPMLSRSLCPAPALSRCRGSSTPAADLTQVNSKKLK